MKEISSIVQAIQKDRIPSDRIKKRKEWEDQAIDIISKNVGKLTKGQIEEIIALLDSDLWVGQQINKRFGLLLWGRNRKLIIQNDEKAMNLLFSQIYDKEKLEAVEEITSQLRGVGDGFVSCLLYLKNRDGNNIFLGATREGIRAAFPEEASFFGSFKNRYLNFNKLANELKNRHNLKPQEMDIILTNLPAWTTEPLPEKEEPVVSKPESIDINKLKHEDVQGILVELGNLLKYKTYVADPSKPYKNKTLGDSATLKKMPLFTYDWILNTVKLIDVIWFRAGEDEFPVACFEIEHTTDVTKGLLRLYNLKSLGTKLFIIAPKNVETKFETEVNKTPFREIKSRYHFRSYQDLAAFYESAKKYYDSKKRFLG